jgi:hypothetical protein
VSCFSNQFTVTFTVVIDGAALDAVPEIVTTYAPAVVPGFAGGVGAWLPPPQPVIMLTPARAMMPRSPARARRLRSGAMNSSTASASPPPPSPRLNAAALDGVELIVSVEVAAVEPVIDTEEFESAQVNGSAAVAGDDVTAHASAIGPVKPPEGVTEITDELPVEAPGAIEMSPPLLSAKAGINDVPATVTVEFVETLIAPVAASAALTVTV